MTLSLCKCCMDRVTPCKISKTCCWENVVTLSKSNDSKVSTPAVCITIPGTGSRQITRTCFVFFLVYQKHSQPANNIKRKLSNTCKMLGWYLKFLVWRCASATEKKRFKVVNTTTKKQSTYINNCASFWNLIIAFRLREDGTLTETGVSSLQVPNQVFMQKQNEY